MIDEFGHFSLVLALAVTIVQAIIPLLGAQRRIISFMILAENAAIIQFILISLAFFSLIHAYVVSDFSVVNVAENSHTAKPLLYKVTGVWGNHEGSLLLWTMILSVFGVALAAFNQTLPLTLKARVLSVQAMVSFNFLLFILLTSNPFHRLSSPPIEGNGLNPLLQDPGLAFHPPLLYLGYVGFSIVFSFAIAALIEGHVDPTWAKWTRPWILIAWIFLTLGIALGSWWAYYELGWGGWWYWDPVENAALVPWLSGTALLHTTAVLEKRDALKGWTILLAIITFSLSLLGTFLVRSGILSSVHAFASDPTRGLFILVLLVCTVGGSLILFAIRTSIIQDSGIFSLISREGGLFLCAVLLAVATAIVLLGTLYPLLAETVGLGKLSVGAPFFNRTFDPLMMLLMLLMGAGPFLTWKYCNSTQVLRQLRLPLILAIMVAGICSALETMSALLIIGLSLSVWLIVATLLELQIHLFRVPWSQCFRRVIRTPKSAYGMTAAHCGLAILVAGIVAVTAFGEEKVLSLPVGNSVDFMGYNFTLESFQTFREFNYQAESATVIMKNDVAVVTILHPERRQYINQSQLTTEAAIYTTHFADFYIVIGSKDIEGKVSIHLYYRPFISLLWYGVILMSLGGLLSLSHYLLLGREKGIPCVSL